MSRIEEVHPAAFWIALAALWVMCVVAIVWSVVVLSGHAG